VPWDLAESQRISGKCWPKVAGFFANQASRSHNGSPYLFYLISPIFTQILPLLLINTSRQSCTMTRWTQEALMPRAARTGARSFILSRPPWSRKTSRASFFATLFIARCSF